MEFPRFAGHLSGGTGSQRCPVDAAEVPTTPERARPQGAPRKTGSVGWPLDFFPR